MNERREGPEPSWRKPVGMILILAIIAAWAALVASVPVGWLPGVVQALFYGVAGVVWIWILPLRRLLRWMELGPRRK